MKINSINLHNFRNYAEERFVFAPGVNVISGENAQGKTNLLEAAAALSTIKLFRTGQKKKECGLVRRNAPLPVNLKRRTQNFRLHCDYLTNVRQKFGAMVCE